LVQGRGGRLVVGLAVGEVVAQREHIEVGKLRGGQRRGLGARPRAQLERPLGRDELLKRPGR